MRVVVIGAGLGGLSAAAHLVGRGHDVLVLERGSVPGGRAGLLAQDGFRLQTGPTVLTMPELLGQTFAAAGAEMDRYVTIDRVDPMFRAVYPDGSVLHMRHDRTEMTEEIRRFANARDAGAFNEFCDWLSDLYEVEMRHFIDVNDDSLMQLAKRWRALTELFRLGGFGRLGRRLASFFEDERLRRVFSFQSMYAGIASDDALALYAVMTYMGSVGGVFAPQGGMHAVATGLARAVTDAGITIRYDTPVTRILRGGDGAVEGVEIGGAERITADAVVCNADLPIAYRTLLGGIDAPRVARRGQYSPSCLLWVAGVRGLPPAEAAHHNVHFGAEWDPALKVVIKRGLRMPDPTVLVTLHSLGDTAAAPPGCSTIYALEPVPNLDGRLNWARDGDRFADELRQRVTRHGYPTSDVVVERAFDPLDWESMGMERGTPFALAHTARQTGPLRPNNVERRVPGLVFAGSSTRPGVGVPMVVISGKLAAERVEEYAKATAVVRW